MLFCSLVYVSVKKWDLLLGEWSAKICWNAFISFFVFQHDPQTNQLCVVRLVWVWWDKNTSPRQEILVVLVRGNKHITVAASWSIQPDILSLPFFSNGLLCDFVLHSNAHYIQNNEKRPNSRKRSTDWSKLLYIMSYNLFHCDSPA